MTEKPVLPIDDMSLVSFNNRFKKEHLDDKVLKEDALKKIDELFSVGDESTGYIWCDENEAHSYECVNYYHPSTGIVNRLTTEIRRYRDRLSEIEKLTKDR